VQQCQCVSGYRVAQACQPSGLFVRKRIQIAPDNFDEQEFAQVKKHAPHAD
jgi:hypothetical protein